MPSVQQSTLVTCIEEDTVSYIHNIKNDMLNIALCEMDDAKQRCSISSKDDLMNTTKDNPIN